MIMSEEFGKVWMIFLWILIPLTIYAGIKLRKESKKDIEAYKEKHNWIAIFFVCFIAMIIILKVLIFIIERYYG